MPRLRKVYVRDSNFPQILLSPRPRANTSFAQPTKGSDQQQQPLEVYAKGPDDLDWVTSIAPIATQSSASADPLGQRIKASLAMEDGQGPRWRGEARKSVFVLDGRSGFLTPGFLPSPPKSAGQTVRY